MRDQIMNPRLPFYQRMLVAAGFPEATEGSWSDGMVDAVVLWGDETRVTERLQELFKMGATEILVSPITAGRDSTASYDRTMRLLGQAAKSVTGA